MDPLGLLVVVACLAAAAAVFASVAKARRLAWIPGPPTLPIIGNAHQIIGAPEDFFRFLCKCYKEYGGIFRIWIVNYPIVMVQSVEYIQPLLRCSKNITKSVEYDFLKPYIGEGLLVSTGEKWQQRRKMLTPSFHLGILENLTQPMHEAAGILVEQLKKHSLDGKPFDVLPYIKMCALDIMIETSLGRKLNAQTNPLSSYVKAIETMSHISMKRTRVPFLRPDILFKLSPLYWKEIKAANIMKKFSSESIIERRKSKTDGSNGNFSDFSDSNIPKRKKRLALLDLLLEVQKEKGLSDSDIQEEVDTFVFEGHDTTSAGTSFGLFLLGHHPDVQEKILEELNEVAPDFLENGISLQDLGKLEYLERCVKEILRLYPSALIVSRRITTPLETKHGTIPVGTTVVMNFYNHHRDEQYFPNPELFDPDRFLPERNDKRHPFAYVPFSAGPRNCIGQKFAMIEMKILLANILKHYQVISTRKPGELELIANLIITSSSGITIALSERESK